MTIEVYLPKKERMNIPKKRDRLVQTHRTMKALFSKKQLSLWDGGKWLLNKYERSKREKN